MMFRLFLLLWLSNNLCFGYVNDLRCFLQRKERIPLFAQQEKAGSKIALMVNGMPGPMALEVAKVCLDRNIKLIPYGYTGSTVKQGSIEVEGSDSKQTVEFIKGLGSAVAGLKLKELKRMFPGLIIVDFTTPTAVRGNVQSYVEANCDFVMGTTGFDADAVSKVFNNGQNYAVIAPNMAKQIVALQAAVDAAAKRFPGAFAGYQLQVTESHQSTKVDTSGTAKAIVKDLEVLNGVRFNLDDIVKIRDTASQLAFGVPEESLLGHAFHTYSFRSNDGSVSFELKHNVCGRRIYAEGTIDAVEFLHRVRSEKAKKRLYNMIDVLESNQ